jgi:hypothetical protein
LLQDARADTPAPDAEARVWQTLSKQLSAPLPPTAAAASRALTVKGATSAATWLATPLVKGLLGLVAVSGVAAGFSYRGMRSPAVLHSSSPPVATLPVSSSGSALPPSSPDTLPSAQDAVPTGSGAPDPLLSAAESSSSLAQETALLRAAQHALSLGTSRSAARAHALVNEHATRFPDGKLAQSREAVRVLALCALRRTQEAHRAQRQFLREWPDSPLRPRVESACRNGQH